jgi:PAS domain S-box-containing protein
MASEATSTSAFDDERYRLLVDSAPDAMVVVDAKGSIELVNLQTEKLFGYARTELIGQSLEVLIPDRFRAGHAAHVARFIAQPTVRPMGSGLELFGRHKAGTEIPIEVSLSPMRTSRGTWVAAAIRDISERKRIEAAAKLNADRLASAVESIQDPFALFDDEGGVVQCNSAYRRLVGEALPGQLIGRSYTEILDALLDVLAMEGEERDRFRTDRLAEGPTPTGTYDLRTRDGRSYRVTRRPTVEGGIVETVWDLTEDARREEELLLARRAAEAGSAAKSEFLSSMSHELRTPLNAILGFAQLLTRDKKQPLSERQRERTDQILKGGEHLLRLIDDILDLSRIEAGRISISTEPVNALDALREAMRTLEPVAARSGVRVELGAIPETVPMISADRTRFIQILMNYGSNAIKYNRHGGRVEFSISVPSENHVRISVKDTGLGIPADKQDKLFQPFQRAGQETGPIEGTGIGLAITKRLAELMGGSVGFVSIPSEGSEFWVDVPIHSSGARSSAEPFLRAAAADSTLGASDGSLILYVEDNPANVIFMKDLLSAFDGIEVVTAPTAEIGVELARARKPKVIIMDINLPGMSGLDALHALRATPETESIPVIALTAAASERDRQRGERAGFYRYLTKPVRVDELEMALQALLSSDGE